MNRPLPPEITNWLKTVLAPDYLNPVQTEIDTIDVLSSFPSLRPKTNVYTDEYGRPELLLCIHGTLPAVIGSSVYRIPIELWVPKSYPQVPPFCFVTPTPDMQIHPGNYVDTNGRCYHPYISNWYESQSNPNNKQTTHNAKEMLKLLAIAFGKEPPVYSKPPDYKVVTHSHQPPVPLATHPTHLSNSNLPKQQQPPPLPPHPLTPNGTGRSQNPPLPPHPLTPTGTGRSQNPPLPPHPLTPTGTGRPHNPPVPPQLTGPNTISYAMPPNQQPVIAPRPKQLDIMDLPEPTTPNSVSNQAISSPLHNSSFSSPPPPPKVSPNPQKLAAISSIHSALNQIAQSEIQPMITHNDIRLLQTNENLNWMFRSVRTEIVELDRITQASTENEAILTEKIQQAEALINQISQNPAPPKIDDVVCAENVVYNQLYDLVADINAIEDTVYVLSKALDCGKINLDSFLKHTRNLGREQFMKKALVEKISIMLGLDTRQYC